MEIYRFAPKSVVEALSPNARIIIEKRIKHNVLRNYIEPVPNIRIRCFKPSILYSSYTISHDPTTYETIYEVAAEEDQCKWAQRQIDKISDLPLQEYLRREREESVWCWWEDIFNNGGSIPPLMHPNTYTDTQQNTHAHMLAYACINRIVPDLEEFEKQFKALESDKNPDMLKQNIKHQTPLMILLDNHEIDTLTEVLLLRIAPCQRLEALPYKYWKKSWGTLNMDMTIDNIEILAEKNSKTEGFLGLYLRNTHNYEMALDYLFRSSYKLHANHVKQLTYQELTAINTEIVKFKSWHNLTLWTALRLKNYETTYPNQSQHYTRKLYKILQARSDIIKEELIQVVYHPSNYKNILLY